jgi:CheY-like chemotaxis protein
MSTIQILVVEDEEITAMDIRSRLEELGYTICASTNSAEEAISLAQTSKPDLVLMDMVLKGEMDGVMAAETISVKEHIPVVFLTAFNDNETFNRAKLSSPYGYITKPFETRDLYIAIELALFKHGSEKKISEANKRYRSVMENALCGIFLHDINGVIFDVNNQMEKIFATSKDKIIGSHFQEFQPKTELEYYSAQMQKLLIEKSIGPISGRIQQPLVTPMSRPAPKKFLGCFCPF